MPFYEYECQSCKFYREVMQRITDPPLRKCPSCGRNTLCKLISAPNFRLKGAGWYETDFKSEQESKRNLAQADKAEKAEKEAQPAGQSKAAEQAGESKPGGLKPGDSKPSESKPSESKPVSEAASPPRSVAVSRSPARGVAASREGAGVRRGTQSKAAASHRPSARRPGVKAAVRKVSARSTRGKSRR